jgi:hypothetical protein
MQRMVDFLHGKIFQFFFFNQHNGMIEERSFNPPTGMLNSVKVKLSPINSRLFNKRGMLYAAIYFFCCLLAINFLQHCFHSNLILNSCTGLFF